MAKKTRTELSTLAINTNLPDNTQELITPTTERAQLTDERESVVNYKDDLGGVPNAGKFLTVATDGESLTMVDEPSGVPDWVTFITAVRNQMLLKAGGDGTGTSEAWLKFTSYDGLLSSQINFNGIDGSFYINGSQSQINLTSQISFIIGGTPRLTISSGGEATFGGGSSTNRVIQLQRGTQGSDSSMVITYGSPYLSIGGAEFRSGNNTIQTIGFGYHEGTGKQPAEIGFETTNTGGGTKGDLVFATRNGTTVSDVPTEKMRITAGGVVQARYGISFPNQSAGSGTSTSETLDAYEEGTWTPTLLNANGNESTEGTYTRIGNTVRIGGLIIFGSQSNTTILTIQSLPYVVGTVNEGTRGGISVAYSTSNTLYTIIADNGSAAARGFGQGATTNPTLASLSGTRVYFGGTYQL